MLDTVKHVPYFGPITGPSKDILPEAVGDLTGQPYRERLASYANLPSVAGMTRAWDGQKLLVCGGGASIAQTIPKIKDAAKDRKRGKRVQIAACNKTHDWLLKRGVKPTFGVLCDPRPHVAHYMTPQQDVIYLLGASLHRSVFEKFIAAKAAFAVWMPLQETEDREYLEKTFPDLPFAFVPGCSTVGMRSVPLGTVLGFEDFELHGFDSCFTPSKHGSKLYAYDKPESTHDRRDMTLSLNDGSSFRYIANTHMAQQVEQFPKMVKESQALELHGKKFPQRIKVAGDGVLPWLAYKSDMHADMKRMDKKYGHIKAFDYRTEGAKHE